MTVGAPQRPRRQTLRALFEEARQHARRRRAKYAALAAALLIAGVGAIIAIDRGGTTSHVRDPSAQTTSTGRLSLTRQPYMGVSCARPNSIACDRVGLAVWLRRPASRLTASIGGRDLAMDLPCGQGNNRPSCRSYCRDPGVSRDQPCGTYFLGFLRPAGLLNGPLKVQPDRGRYLWLGYNKPVALVRLVTKYRDGKTAQTELRVALGAGWG